MTTRLILGGVLGGLVAFAWGAVSWMALPWHQSTLQSFKDEAAVARVIQANAPIGGTYLLAPSHGEQRTAEQAGVPKGLMLFGAVRRAEPNMRTYYIRGLVVQMVGALLLTWLLTMLPGLTYGQRVRVVVMVALIAGALVRLGDWSWWSFSTSFTFIGIADLMITWGLAGLVIAKVAGPSRTA